MWVFCGGMPRSGSTLQFQLTAHLVEQAGLGSRIDWVRPEELSVLFGNHSSTTSFKVCKTHLCTAEIQREFRLGNAKGVYVYRDIRDVVVSRMRKTGQSFDDLQRAGFVDSILAAFDAWTALDGMLVSRYDDMTADVAGELARIAEHLGITIGRAECERVAGHYSVSRQLERIDEARRTGRLRQNGGAVYDPVSNLHVDHIRFGGSGDWRTVLSFRDIATIERRAGSWLSAHGYVPVVGRWGRARLALSQARQRLRSLASRRAHRPST